MGYPRSQLFCETWNYVCKGAFFNYVDKRRLVGIRNVSTFFSIFISQFSQLMGVGGQKKGQHLVNLFKECPIRLWSQDMYVVQFSSFKYLTNFLMRHLVSKKLLVLHNMYSKRLNDDIYILTKNPYKELVSSEVLEWYFYNWVHR